ncbi:NADH dehydrogenase 1 subunit C2 [Caerostris darwini]|uniref:NADH dehydrogenase [ubiquinone] 1 subunit C2 n=1 Tax=Caerostris darwini TaxID=1538125 RepID=A0AAV4TMB2_9ARAC|nr:NADH dehydrogenase 1 subunit C2 [Caerostris darwini]
MPYNKESLYSKYFFPIGLGLTAGLSPAVSNYYLRRPLYAGIHRHLFGFIVGFVAGQYVEKYTQNRFAERDAVIKHYIELHPEDFVENKRKYKEIFEEWYPVRGQ